MRNWFIRNWFMRNWFRRKWLIRNWFIRTWFIRNWFQWWIQARVGFNVCHPEVVKLQEQCYMQNTNWFYSFFSGRGRVPIYPGDSNRRIGRKNEIDNPVRKCMTLGRHSGFIHVPGETGTTLQKGWFYVVVSQGN